jgi:YHS domain-containing protein
VPPTDAAPKPDEPKPDAPKPDAPKPDEPKSDAPKGEAAASAALGAEEIAQIKKLPEADQPIALAQVTCPVSGEKLGEMGVPLKVTAGGESFFLCCKGCKKEVDKDPAAIVAKLQKKN